MNTIRAFIAVELPEAVRQFLYETALSLADRVPAGAVRWVKPGAMHLTLHFLGDTPVDKLPALGAGLDRVVGHRPSFALHLGELGCFPNPRRPRVIWAGVAGTGPALADLKRAVDEMLAPLGWAPEDDKPFQAHLTLGRVKHSNQLIQLPWGERLAPRPVPVDAIYLIESQLRPDGPVYTIRHKAPLAKPAAPQPQ